MGMPQDKWPDKQKTPHPFVKIIYCDQVLQDNAQALGAADSSYRSADTGDQLIMPKRVSHVR